MEKTQTYGFEMIQIEEIEEIRKRERTMLIDLRDENSYREGHIKNARNFPITYIEDWKKSIPERIGLILYCEHGNQSLLAARKLRERKGKVYTVTGGYQAYTSANIETVISTRQGKRD